MHAPEEHADPVLGRFGEALVPEQQLPVESPALGPERRVEQPAIGLVARGHVLLQVMAGNHLVKDRRAREVDIVAAHAHQLCLVRHRAVGNETLMTSPPVKNGFTSCCSGDIMAIRHESRQSCGNGDQVVRVEIFDRLDRQVADQGGLLAGLDVHRLDVLEGRSPVVAVAHVARGLFHFVLAPGELGLGELDQLFGRVRDHLELELAQEGLAADRVADDRRTVLAASPRRAPAARLARLLAAGTGSAARCAALHRRRRRRRRRPPPPPPEPRRRPPRNLRPGRS